MGVDDEEPTGKKRYQHYKSISSSSGEGRLNGYKELMGIDEVAPAVYVNAIATGPSKHTK